ncbi:MAG: hypothetical protein HY304_06155 [candidate division Zixibacteria bacterium]|nr:hypothetical protein [candidate division Zixibacteria bacterium]
MPRGSFADRLRESRLDPMAIWRWGFALLLLVAGVWLVVAAPVWGGASGRTLGWVVIGYAVVRPLFGRLVGSGRRSV